MRALSPRRCFLPLVAAALILGCVSPGFADRQAEPKPDSLEAGQKFERKARRIQIGEGQIQFDDGSMIAIDKDAIRISVEEAMKEAERTIVEMNIDVSDSEDSDSDARFRVVRRSDKVRFGEDVRVGPNELVNGDVVAVGGDVTIEGKVAGDVVSVFGDLQLESTAIVNGEAVSVFGRLVQEPGARVRGQTVSVGPDFICGKIWENSNCPSFVLKRGWLSAASLALMGILIIITLLVAMVFRDGVGRVNDAIRKDVLKSWLYGLLTEVILFIVTLILAVTIIGIPLAVLLWIIVGLACLWAFAGVSLRVGEAFAGDSAGSRSRTGHVFIGAIVILIVPAIARILSIIGGIFWGPALGVRILGSLITWFALTTGLGAVVVTRFGTRNAGRREEPEAVLPPAAS